MNRWPATSNYSIAPLLATSCSTPRLHCEDEPFGLRASPPGPSGVGGLAFAIMRQTVVDSSSGNICGCRRFENQSKSVALNLLIEEVALPIVMTGCFSGNYRGVFLSPHNGLDECSSRHSSSLLYFLLSLTTGR